MDCWEIVDEHAALRPTALIAAHRIFSRADVPDRDLTHYLRRHDVDIDHCINVAGPIVRLAVAFEHGLFGYDPFGEAAAVVSVRDENAERLIDLAAWSLKDPMIFAPFLDHAGLLGGDAVLNPASFHAGPCPIWLTPLDWLQAGCKGAVVSECRTSPKRLHKGTSSRPVRR